MTTDTLANGLKAVFGTSVNATGTNFASIPTLKADNTPGGHISPTDLISVLDRQVPEIYPFNDFDTYLTIGKAYITTTTSTTGSPTPGAAMSALLEVHNSNNNRYIQTLTTFNDNRTFQRLRMATGTWSSWIRNDNFGALTAADLVNTLCNEIRMKNYVFSATSSSNRGVKIASASKACYSATLCFGHPNQCGMVDISVCIATGTNAGNPYESYVKTRIGIPSSRISAVYYKENDVNYFEILNNSAAYSGMVLRINNVASSTFQVTDITALSRETGDVTVHIS